MNPIAHVHTCFGEKFGVPRQPNLVKEAWGELVFEPDYRSADAVRGLEGFSHVWLVFIFHQAVRGGWKPLVRPPRLGGNEKIGVFASRSPFRPNPIGLSVVKLNEVIHDEKRGPVLKLSGVDLVDGTPVFDIKPYLPYADCIAEATGGFAVAAPRPMRVIWSNNCMQPDEIVRELIESTLSMDPRPAYHHDDEVREYGCLIAGHNVKWRVVDGEIEIVDLA